MTHTFTAFMQNPNAPRPDNPIHSTDGGREYGFEGALVGGIHVYGWTSDAFVAAHGSGWLADGWVDVRFRRPVYQGNAMEVAIDGPTFKTVRADGEICLAGQFGIGKACWFEELTATAFEPGTVPNDDNRIDLTLANAPVGVSLPALALNLSPSENASFLPYAYGHGPARYHEAGLLQPAWIAGQMIGLLRRTYRYGPAIHARSQIQHLAQGHSGGTFAITGHCLNVYERKGHHYIVNDGSLWNAGNQLEIARMRHTAIFQVRKET